MKENLDVRFSGYEDTRENSGDNGERVPPVPIPNTEVKPFSADGTWLETARESRSLPDPKLKELSKSWALFVYAGVVIQCGYLSKGVDG